MPWTVPEPPCTCSPHPLVQHSLGAKGGLRGWAPGGFAGCRPSLTLFPRAVSPAEGEVSADEEGFENLWATASTFIVLFLLSLFYSTTVTLFKVAWLWHREEGAGRVWGPGSSLGWTSSPEAPTPPHWVTSAPAPFPTMGKAFHTVFVARR